MDHEVKQSELAKEAKDEPKRRSERIEERLDLRHKGVRTGMAAGGLLALMGLSALLLA